MISACAGIICTISSMIRYEVRNRNRYPATATEASSDTSEASTTVLSVTSMLFRKNSQQDPIPDAWPLNTEWKLPSVGGRATGPGSVSRSPGMA